MILLASSVRLPAESSREMCGKFTSQASCRNVVDFSQPLTGDNSSGGGDEGGDGEVYTYRVSERPREQSVFWRQVVEPHVANALGRVMDAHHDPLVIMLLIGVTVFPFRKVRQRVDEGIATIGPKVAGGDGGHRWFVAPAMMPSKPDHTLERGRAIRRLRLRCTCARRRRTLPLRPEPGIARRTLLSSPPSERPILLSRHMHRRRR